MKLASIEKIKNVLVHPNADALEIAEVLGFNCIVKKGIYSPGDLVVFIQPDTILPDAPWATFYKSKSSRVKAIKLRGEWSKGIVESLANVGLQASYSEGDDVAEVLGVTKYEPPAPQDLSAKGGLPFGMGKTDEERVNNLKDREIPFGELCDITLKYDGSSITVFYKDGQTGVTQRTLELKTDCSNKFVDTVKRLGLIEKLTAFCEKENVNLALRGELYGGGVQNMAINPHCKLPLSIAIYSVYLMDENKYARKGHKYYFTNVAKELGIETVEMIEENVIFSAEHIKKYATELTQLNGKMFEGVVVQHSKGSFKIINDFYDSKK